MNRKRQREQQRASLDNPDTDLDRMTDLNDFISSPRPRGSATFEIKKVNCQHRVVIALIKFALCVTSYCHKYSRISWEWQFASLHPLSIKFYLNCRISWVGVINPGCCHVSWF